MERTEILADLGINDTQVKSAELKVTSPADGSNLGQLRITSLTEIDTAIAAAKQAFSEQKITPAPKRSELIRIFGNGGRESGFGYVEKLHAPHHQHHKLFERASFGSRH